MEETERRRHMNALRGAASYLGQFDSDDFGDDVEIHGETAARWAIAEIERLDRLVGIYECREGVPEEHHGLIGKWDDLECDHDHTRSPLELPKSNTARTHQQRVMVMRQSWPTVTTDDNGVVHFGDAFHLSEMRPPNEYIEPDPRFQMPDQTPDQGDPA